MPQALSSSWVDEGMGSWMDEWMHRWLGRRMEGSMGIYSKSIKRSCVTSKGTQFRDMRDTEETQQPQQAGNTRAAHQQVEGIQGERTGGQLIRAEPPYWRNQNKWKIINIIIYKR